MKTKRKKKIKKKEKKKTRAKTEGGKSKQTRRRKERYTSSGLKVKDLEKTYLLCRKSEEKIWRKKHYFRGWWWKLRRGEGRWKGFSCVVIFVMKWSSTKKHRSLLDLSGVGAGEEQEKHSRYLKEVDWAAKKWIFDRRGKLSLGCCATGHERKEN